MIHRLIRKQIFFKACLSLCLLVLNFNFIQAQISQDEVPMIGAEIFIEPGQKPAEIEGWFRIMKEHGLSITRIRMFENYMHQPGGKWDFTLFDQAFKAGEKYGIKIYANLFPATSFADLGGLKFPKSEEQLTEIAKYIEQVVTHFKQFKSLYGWVPVNEPGVGAVPSDAYAKSCFGQWKKAQPTSAYNSGGYPVLDFSEQHFLVYYNTWFLSWLTHEIHRYDPGKPVHVNNHNIFQNAAEYDFPEWRKFLTSLGGSAHASWHFDYFTRRQYSIAMSANSEMLRSGAGNIPWLMTELQGGNNTYSGFTPMCPTKEETAQWLWTTIATGSKGAIFWSLNPRSSGLEAGEWAMLDFQDKASDRLQAAAAVTKVIDNNSRLFARAKVVETGINVLYCREAMWIEKKLKAAGEEKPGREVGGVMKSALAYFEALSGKGLQVNLKEMGEFDFAADDYNGRAIILAHQISIPSRYWPLLENFVAKGGKLIVDGLTGYYDENARCLLRDGFPLEALFGGSIREFKVVDNLFDAPVLGLKIPAHLWQGTILPGSGKPVASADGATIAIRNKRGKGEVLWVPSLLGLGSRLKGDYSMLIQLLEQELPPIIAASPIAFKEFQSNMLMKTLRNGGEYISVIINKSKEKRTVALQTRLPLKNATIIFADKTGSIKGSSLEINPEETIVLTWR